MTRDPRQDPRPGDVVRVEDADGWTVRVVTALYDEYVRWVVTGSGNPGGGGHADLSWWRKTNADATVLHPSGVTYEGSPALGILRDAHEKR